MIEGPVKVKRRLFNTTKTQLARLGAAASDSALKRLQLALNYARVGKWLEKKEFLFPIVEDSRKALFRAIADQVKGNGQLLYLEFGVHKGAATRYWTQLITDPSARFHGFDSFEGLPESFDDYKYKRGRFDTRGNLPDISDPRVTFHKGWFKDTLEDFVVPEHDLLLVILDADLYSSTRTVFDFIGECIRPGTVLYFDEFHYVEHEARAFAEFMDESGRSFEGLAAQVGFGRCAFRCIA